MEVRIETAEDIRNWRGRIGLSQEALARLAGVSVFTLSRWERRIGEPSRLSLRGLQGIFEDYTRSEEEKHG